MGREGEYKYNGAAQSPIVAIAAVAAATKAPGDAVPSRIIDYNDDIPLARERERDFIYIRALGSLAWICRGCDLDGGAGSLYT